MKKTEKKTKRKQGDGIRRIPRQGGITMMVKHYNQIDDERERQNKLNQIKDHVLNQYIKEGFRINGMTMELNELAIYLDMPLKGIIRKITRYGDIMGGKDGEAISRAVQLFSFQGLMATRSLVLGQAQSLLRSQGDSYVPFLTSEVNRSLANLIQNDNAWIGYLKAIKTETKSQPSVVINNQQATMNTGGNTEQALNINQAVRLINDNRDETLLESTDMQNRLLASHVTEEVPEVVATQQRGYTTPDQIMVPEKKRKVPHHDNRRESEGEIIK